MGNLFNPDNKFFVFMGRVADLTILNLLCILCCLPVVTAGASISAMFYMTMKIVRNEDTYIIKGFFHSFKQNLKQGIIIHLIMVVLAVFLFIDIMFTYQMRATGGTAFTVLFYFFLVLAVVYFMVFIYIYPLQAKFYNPIKYTFRNALLMSIRHFPSTLVMAAVTAAPVILMVFSATIMMWGTLFFIICGFSTIAYLNSRLLVKIFDNYIPKEDESDSTVEGGDGEIANGEIETSVFKNLQPTNEIDTVESDDTAEEVPAIESTEGEA